MLERCPYFRGVFKRCFTISLSHLHQLKHTPMVNKLITTVMKQLDILMRARRIIMGTVERSPLQSVALVTKMKKMVKLKMLNRRLKTAPLAMIHLKIHNRQPLVNFFWFSSTHMSIHAPLLRRKKEVELSCYARKRSAHACIVNNGAW